mmetsp:Transcript_10201/g.15536  ORF Transcript_10201/g.15536 Transcript_10201/m.15536 type:complete len:98 (-) Transcript_10201:276-569(-)
MEDFEQNPIPDDQLMICLYHTHKENTTKFQKITRVNFADDKKIADLRRWIETNLKIPLKFQKLIYRISITKEENSRFPDDHDDLLQFTKDKMGAILL